ncbi:Target SNARE coiled-coil domain protein [Kalmanozyma brasiliensis GHG001]|uniref:Epsin n=1 Tax=Kalmanozyma brasiliensis (strain GHG001) TaxID=1365824 RepID=V5F137_KALBG|nr:Target SNARE coiled-coil domain protein [Kalmanozyma brasiliensis GHG001]EST08989.1 Target SNARE coiled-coil domain protein [Kalmanozyma brasiliensis GHG001]
MARDRLAAMRAQQAGGYGGYGGGNNGYGDHSYPTQQQGAAQAGYGQPQAGYAAPPQQQPQQQVAYGYGQQQPGYAAQPQPGAYGAPQQGGYAAVPVAGQDSYEMQSVASEKPAGDMNSFFTDISEIQDTIRLIDENVNKISDLHSRSLNNMDEASAQYAEQQLASIQQETSSLTNAVKNRIKLLEAQTKRVPAGGDKNVRNTQIGAVKNRFKETIQRYQQVEQGYRQKYRARAERQFRIVKPDATQQEIKAALDDDQNGQIFSQALLNSNRHGEAKGALREVQERHEDIKRIERTITELAQLFNEMSILVDEQDDALNVIQEQGQQVETDMNQGLQHTNKAVDSARKARKKRWICFWVIIILIIAIAAVVVAVICTRPGNCGQSNGNNRRSLVARAVLYGQGMWIEKMDSRAMLLPDLGI